MPPDDATLTSSPGEEQQVEHLVIAAALGAAVLAVRLRRAWLQELADAAWEETGRGR